jgi:hypothetical protein
VPLEVEARLVGIPLEAHGPDAPYLRQVLPNGSRLSCGRACPQLTTDRRADARRRPDRPPDG